MKAAPRSSRPRTAALSPGSRSAETRSPGSGISPHGRWLRSLALSPGCAEALQRCRTWFLTVDRRMEQVVVLPVLRCVCVWLSLSFERTLTVSTPSALAACCRGSGTPALILPLWRGCSAHSVELNLNLIIIQAFIFEVEREFLRFRRIESEFLH